MAFPVYDYRTDARNVLVAPQIRCRFVAMGPGQAGEAHSHDLGYEVILVLQGRARIDIEDEARELEAGQMCVALANQVHSVRAVGEQPLLMYLSVTPHIQPTHTWWGQPGARLPHRFLPSSAYDVEAGQRLASRT